MSMIVQYCGGVTVTASVGTKEYDNLHYKFKQWNNSARRELTPARWDIMLTESQNPERLVFTESDPEYHELRQFLLDNITQDTSLKDSNESFIIQRKESNDQVSPTDGPPRP